MQIFNIRVLNRSASRDEGDFLVKILFRTMSNPHLTTQYLISYSYESKITRPGIKAFKFVFRDAHRNCYENAVFHFKGQNAQYAFSYVACIQIHTKI